MRTGTVATIDNRNWELRDHVELVERFAQSRAIALTWNPPPSPPTAFVSAPYGTLLCVSDKPPHGELKLPGMASAFYRRQVNQHLEIGIRAPRTPARHAARTPALPQAAHLHGNRFQYGTARLAYLPCPR